MSFLVLLASLLAGCEDTGDTVAVNLNFFASDRSAAIAPDGRAATLSENDVTAPVTIDFSRFYVPADALTVTFEYELSVAAGGEDYLDFFVADTSRPVFSDGGASGTYAGNVTWDVRPHRATSVAVIFDLHAGFADRSYGSTLTIRDVALTRGPAGG
jgi:hypothetical protein